MDANLEALDVALDLVQLEESFTIFVLGVLNRESDVESIISVRSRVANVNIEQSVILDTDPARLLVDVVANVLGLKAQTREGQSRGRFKLGCISGVTLLAADLVLVAEVSLVRNERLAREADVVDDKVNVLGLKGEGAGKSVSEPHSIQREQLTVNSTRGKGIA